MVRKFLKRCERLGEDFEGTNNQNYLGLWGEKSVGHWNNVLIEPIYTSKGYKNI